MNAYIVSTSLFGKSWLTVVNACYPTKHVGVVQKVTYHSFVLKQTRTYTVHAQINCKNYIRSLRMCHVYVNGSDFASMALLSKSSITLLID